MSFFQKREQKIQSAPALAFCARKHRTGEKLPLTFSLLRKQNISLNIRDLKADCARLRRWISQKEATYARKVDCIFDPALGCVLYFGRGSSSKTTTNTATGLLPAKGYGDSI